MQLEQSRVLHFHTLYPPPKKKQKKNTKNTPPPPPPPQKKKKKKKKKTRLILESIGKIHLGFNRTY